MDKQTKKRLTENRAKFIREGSEANWLSLAKVMGKKIIDLEGYISAQFGLDTPVFNVCHVVFEDGTLLSLEGEHDIAYVPNDSDTPGLSVKDMLLCFDPGDIDNDDDEDFRQNLRWAEEEG